MTVNLTAEEYSSQTHYQEECRRIFSRAWQLIGSSSSLAENGSYSTTTIATTPIFVIRAEKGLRAFKNICPHRGMPLFKDSGGSCEGIVCPYHGAQFDADGALAMTGPWFGKDVPIELKSLRLTPVAAEEWRGLIFVAINPFESLIEQLGDLPEEVGETPIQDYVHFERRKLTVKGNWKSYFDQYNEIWHTPNIHPSDKNIGILDYRAEPMNRLIRMTTGSVEGADGAYYGGKWMQCWPNWTLVLFEGGIKTARINPTSATTFDAYHDFYFADTSPENAAKCRKAADATIDIFLQDAEICEIILANYLSGDYRAGPLHPQLERAVQGGDKAGHWSVGDVLTRAE